MGAAEFTDLQKHLHGGWEQQLADEGLPKGNAAANAEVRRGQGDVVA